MPSLITVNYAVKVSLMRKDKLTSFERQVLKAALRIPLGQTRSYQWIAKAIRKPKAVRAVGQALKKNPFPILVPCHRIIRADGSLGGYAGGQKKKRKLLRLEKEIALSLRRQGRE